MRASKQYAERSAPLSKEHITLLGKEINTKEYKVTDFEKVIDFENLYNAYRRSKKGKGYKVSAAKFATKALEGVHLIKEMLEDRTYTVAPYNQFKVFEPKERVIKAGAFKDKVVQHSLCDNVLLPKLKDIFIQNNFAGQKGKGTLFGLDQLRNDMLSFYGEHGTDGYILKCDITKFFYTIDHEVLRHIIYRHFEDEGVRWLCDLYIDSTEGLGLPLGNQISQVFALLYLNNMDHMIIEELDIKYYGRYMDDFYLICHSKEHLKYCLKRITEHVHSLKLTLNNKTQIIPFKNGVDFLGFHTYVTVEGRVIRKLKGSNKRHIKKELRKKSKLVKSGKMSMQEFNESYRSWKNHALHGNCIKLVNNMDKFVVSLFTI